MQFYQADAFFAPTMVQAESSDGKIVVDGVMELQAIYMPVGGEQAMSATLESPFTATFQGDVPSDAPMLLEAFDCECVPVTSSQLELKCTLALHADADVQRSIEAAMDAQEVEGRAVPMGITVLLAQKGDTAWDLAKRFRVPTDELERMNPELMSGVSGRGTQVMVFKR